MRSVKTPAFELCALIVTLAAASALHNPAKNITAHVLTASGLHDGATVTHTVLHLQVTSMGVTKLATSLCQHADIACVDGIPLRQQGGHIVHSIAELEAEAALWLAAMVVSRCHNGTMYSAPPAPCTEKNWSPRDPFCGFQVVCEESTCVLRMVHTQKTLYSQVVTIRHNDSDTPDDSICAHTAEHRIRQGEDPTVATTAFCQLHNVLAHECNRLHRHVLASTNPSLCNRPTNGGPSIIRPNGTKVLFHHSSFYRGLWDDSVGREHDCACGRWHASTETQQWPSGPSEPSEHTLKEELARLRVHARWAKSKIRDAGPSTMKHMFGHLTQCLACNVQAEMLNQVRNPAQIRIVASEKVLFADDWVVSSSCNIQRTMGKGLKHHSPILEADQPFESSRNLFYGSVIRDSNMFKMWYQPTAGIQAFAHSTDGLHWVKPNLTVMKAHHFMPNGPNPSYLFVPSPSNVIAELGVSMTVTADSVHNYTAGIECYTNLGGKHDWCDVCLATSSDGINWSMIQAQNGSFRESDSSEQCSTPAAQPGPADSYVMLFPHGKTGGRTLVTRYEFANKSPRDPNFHWRGARGVRFLRNEAANLTAPGVAGRWTIAQRFYLDLQHGANLEPLRRQLYALTVVPYSGLFFGLLNVLEWPEGGDGGQTMRIYLGTSRDGLNFDLRYIYAGLPLVEPGKTGDFDNMVQLSASQFVTHDDQHWLYYKGCPRGHADWSSAQIECKIGLVRFEQDALLYLEPADSGWGVVITKQFVLEGSKLFIHLNMQSENGRALVVILEPGSGMPYEGFGCQHATEQMKGGKGIEILWTNDQDLSSLQNKTIQIQFHIRQASLHSFTILPYT